MKLSDYICPVCGTTKQPNPLCQEIERLKAELKKETELRMFFERALKLVEEQSEALFKAALGDSNAQ